MSIVTRKFDITIHHDVDAESFCVVYYDDDKDVVPESLVRAWWADPADTEDYTTKDGRMSWMGKHGCWKVSTNASRTSVHGENVYVPMYILGLMAQMFANDEEFDI